MTAIPIQSVTDPSHAGDDGRARRARQGEYQRRLCRRPLDLETVLSVRAWVRDVKHTIAERAPRRGSVWLAPDARKVQYRLYYEAEGTVFSDGLLRQHEVPPDSVIINPHVPAPARRRRTAASAGVASSK